MEFFDCNASFGSDVSADVFQPARTVEELQTYLRRAGIAKAVVTRVEQLTGGALPGNRLLADDLRGCDNLYGLWSLLPSHTRELPPPPELLAAMKQNRIIGWRLYPAKTRFLPRPFVLRDWLQLAVERRIPIFANTAHGLTLADLAGLMEAFPQLTVVLTFASDWPSDRFLRPFVAEFPNLHLDLAYMITDGGIESFVGEYGAGRLLFGSGFPHCYLGANMLMIRHAQIADDDRDAIAGGNLERIVKEVLL